MSHRAASAAWPRRSRILVYAGVTGLLVAVDLAVKWQVERLLSSRGHLDLGIVELRLGHNSGVAFGLGSGLPEWVVLVVTSLIAVGVAIVAWWYGPRLGGLGRGGLTAVMAGAVGNIVDRAQDGAVTDYVYTGWFATFNLADALIVGGTIAVVLSSWRSEGLSE